MVNGSDFEDHPKSEHFVWFLGSEFECFVFKPLTELKQWFPTFRALSPANAAYTILVPHGSDRITIPQAHSSLGQFNSSNFL